MRQLEYVIKRLALAVLVLTHATTSWSAPSIVSDGEVASRRDLVTEVVTTFENGNATAEAEAGTLGSGATATDTPQRQTWRRPVSVAT